MKIKYDDSIRLGGIGISPWSRIGPEKWFTDYRIASYYGWDVNGGRAPSVEALTGYSASHLDRLNTQRLLQNPVFMKMLQDKFKDRYIITYNPIGLKLPPEIASSHLKFLGTGSSSRVWLENKVHFREMFGDELPFAPFKILSLKESPDFGEVMGGRDRVIIQHATLSGGKGTFLIGNQGEFTAAWSYLKSKGADKGALISDFIGDAAERSLQCCATRYGIFVGPLQKQIIDSPILLNQANKHTEKFCGAEIETGDPLNSVYDELKSYCETIGRELLGSGYRGIFGVDFLVSPSGRPYILEVNQRMTGVTPLLTMLYRKDRDIPFQLLHILEAGRFEYEITDPGYDTVPPAGAMLILHSKLTEAAALRSNLDSGIYSGDGFRFLAPEYNTDNMAASDILVQRFVPPGEQIKASARLATVYTKQPVLDANENLSRRASSLIDEVYAGVKLDNVG